jgi:hypothetical protein
VVRPLRTDTYRPKICNKGHQGRIRPPFGGRVGCERVRREGWGNVVPAPAVRVYAAADGNRPDDRALWQRPRPPDDRVRGPVLRGSVLVTKRALHARADRLVAGRSRVRKSRRWRRGMGAVRRLLAGGAGPAPTSERRCRLGHWSVHRNGLAIHRPARISFPRVRTRWPDHPRRRPGRKRRRLGHLS